MTALLLIIIVVVLVVGVVVVSQQRSGASKARSLDDAKADARQVIERLGGQVYMLVGDSPASKQALADAGEVGPALEKLASHALPQRLTRP